MALACEEMALQHKDGRARQVCLDLGEIILHRAARNRLGLVAHDDTSEFAIPDTCYFAASALMAAARLHPNGRVFRDQAVFQLRAYVDTFLVKETGLAKTILTREGLGKTYWTRASGWLLWAILAVLRRLPAGDPAAAGFAIDLRVLAQGMANVQDRSGGFHVRLTEPGTPLESTGTLMFAMGAHEGVRRGWLPASFRGPAERAWKFVAARITGDGALEDSSGSGPFPPRKARPMCAPRIPAGSPALCWPQRRR